MTTCFQPEAKADWRRVRSSLDADKAAAGQFRQPRDSGLTCSMQINYLGFYEWFTVLVDRPALLSLNHTNILVEYLLGV